MTNTNEIKMREEFEAWYEPNNKWSPAALERSSSNPNGYKLMQAQSAWTVWQAAYRPKQVGDIAEWEKKYCYLMFLRSEIKDEKSEEIYEKAYNKFISGLSILPQHVENELLKKMGEAIRKIIYEGVQETDGQYKSAKNNKCRHDKFGFEGCEACVEEYLLPLLKEYEAMQPQPPVKELV